MRGRQIVRAFNAGVSRLGVNGIPAGIVLVGGENPETAMILYFLENIITIILVVGRVWWLAPADDPAYRRLRPNFSQLTINGRPVSRNHTPNNRYSLIINYLVAALGLSAGSGLFLFLFVWLVMAVEVSGRVILTSLGGIVAFQLLNFVSDLCFMEPLAGENVEPFLAQNLGRVVLLFLAVFIGLFLALWAKAWFILPFALLKTTLDLTQPLQILFKQAK